jgi:hypothetical protein
MKTPISQKIKNIIEKIGLMIKKLLTKIKAVFTRTKLVNVPMDVYKKGQEIIKKTDYYYTDSEKEKPDFQDLILLLDEFKESIYNNKNEDNDKKIKTFPLEESKIRDMVEGCERSYKRRVDFMNKYTNVRIIALTESEKLKINNIMEGTLTEMKLIQYELIVYTQYLSYATSSMRGQVVVEG